jgi:plastocyanin
MEQHSRQSFFIIFLLIVSVFLSSALFLSRQTDTEDMTETPSADDQAEDAEASTDDVSSTSQQTQSDSVGDTPSEPAQQAQSTIPPTPAPTAPVPTQSNTSDADYIRVVTYTNSGFVPPVIEVEAGQSITFISSSNIPMRITSSDHPTATDQFYPEFSMNRSLGTGGSWTFQFTKVGVWGYKNLNRDADLGAVSVVPQQ